MNDKTFPSEIKFGPLPQSDLTGAQQALAYAKSIAVVDDRSFELAGEEVKLVKDRLNAIEKKRKEMKAPLLQATRMLDEFFDGALSPLRDAEIVIKRTMLAYQQAEQKKADDARRAHEERIRREREAAERKAEEARRTAAAEAERKAREEAAAKARADEAERLAREARERGDRAAAAEQEKKRRAAEDEERRAREAGAKAIQNGEARAQGMMERAAEKAAVPAPVVDAPAAAGVATRSTWAAKVVSLETLVKAVAEGRAPLECLIPDTKVLNRMATALKGGLSKSCPGVEAVETKGLAVKI